MVKFPAFKGALDLINQQGTNIYMYFGTTSYGSDYDPETNNYTLTPLPPKVIKGYVHQISASALVWKQYGLQELGSIEIVCDAKYTDWFKTCMSIVVNGVVYRTFQFGQGKLAIIQDRGHGLIKVALQIQNSQ